MYLKYVLILVCLLALVACEPLQVGEPPTFNSFSVTPISATQAEVRWTAGVDPEELIPPEELTYGIWLVETGEMIGETPNVATSKGALSYSLTELTPATSYDLLVRSSDGAGNYSTNETTQTFTTPAEDSGTYGAEIFATLGSTPNGMLVGRVFDSTQDTIGVLTGTSIRWYIYSGTALTERTDGSVGVGQDIDEAHAVRFRSTANRDDLFLLTSTDLYYAQNNSNGFDSPVRIASGNELPAEGSVGFYEEAGVAQCISFIGADGVGRILTLNTEDDVFELQAELNFAADDIFRLADIDGNGFPDYVRFGDDGLHVAMDDGEDYRFQAEELIEDEAVGSSTVSLFLSDGNGDNQLDLYLFLRDISADETLMRVFHGDGNGVFSRQNDADFAMAFFDEPTFQHYNGDGDLDLVVPQSRSNNAAILQTPFNLSATNTTPTIYVGSTADDVDVALIANLDGLGDRDVVLLSRGQARLVVMPRN